MIKPIFQFLVACLLAAAVLTGPARAAAPPDPSAREEPSRPRQWFRTAGPKKLNGFTAPAKLNERIKVVAPTRKAQTPQSEVPLATEKQVWACQNCTWARKTEDISE